MKKISPNVFWGYIILVFVAVTTSLVGLYFGGKIKDAEKPSPVIIQPSQYPDYDAIKGDNSDPNLTFVKMTSDCGFSGCVNKKPATIDFGIIHKKYKVVGKFSRAYLYIEAAVDYGRPLTVWDDFYFKINGFGGHLISDENLLPVPPGDISRFVYDLRSISYFPSISNKERNKNKQSNINFFVLLQDGVNLDMEATISSDRPGRVIKEVSIYYECFEGSECEIVEIK